MFENLLNLVKENAGDAIINNPAIPNERNDEAVSLASNSIVDGLKNALSGGNLGDLTHLFNNSDNVASSPVMQNIQGGFIQNLMDKFGLDTGTAGNIANNLLPGVLQKLVHKTNDPNDSSFDIQGILGHLGGGSGLDIGSMVKQFAGGGGGGTHGGGGILDTVKGLFQ